MDCCFSELELEKSNSDIIIISSFYIDLFGPGIYFDELIFGPEIYFDELAHVFILVNLFLNQVFILMNYF
jgi:hypothetical protein